MAVARKRTASKRRKHDETAMIAADNLLNVLSELHIAYAGTNPKRFTVGQRNVVLGHAQDARDLVGVILDSLLAIAAAAKPDLQEVLADGVSA